MDARHQYRLEELDELKGRGPCYAVIGDPISHSQSPVMQQAALDYAKRPGTYVRILASASEFPALIERLRTLPFSGWNCTIPHKETMLRLVDELTPEALRLGAVNAVKNESGRLIGHNTDGMGWSRAVEESFGIKIKNVRVAMVGLGGAGRALAVQAALEGAKKLVLVNRTRSKAETLKNELAVWYPAEAISICSMEAEAMNQAFEEVDLVVNATSVGMKEGEGSPVPSSALKARLAVFDTIYNLSETPLMQEARKVGCRVANGASMLLHQGAAAFEFWHGEPAPVDVMREALANFQRGHQR